MALLRRQLGGSYRLIIRTSPRRPPPSLTRAILDFRSAPAAALRTAIRKLEVEEWVEPSKQPLDAYLAECVAGQWLSASTLSSRKNIRLHIDDNPGAQPVTGAAVAPGCAPSRSSAGPTVGVGLSARTVRYVFTILRPS